MDRYSNANDLDQLTGYKNTALNEYRQTQTTMFLQNAYLATAANIWLVNVLDASDLKFSPYVMSALLPGSGQFKQGKKLRGLLFLAVAAGSAGQAIMMHADMLNASILYDQKMDVYRDADQISDVNQAREAAELQYAEVESLLQQRNQALMVAGAAWTLNIIEVWF